MEFGIDFFRSARHIEPTPYVDAFGDTTSKFGWVWFAWIPWVKTWVQMDSPTRRVRYLRACWLFFGITAWKAGQVPNDQANQKRNR